MAEPVYKYGALFVATRERPCAMCGGKTDLVSGYCPSCLGRILAGKILRDRRIRALLAEPDGGAE